MLAVMTGSFGVMCSGAGGAGKAGSDTAGVENDGSGLSAGNSFASTRERRPGGGGDGTVRLRSTTAGVAASGFLAGAECRTSAGSGRGAGSAVAGGSTCADVTATSSSGRNAGGPTARTDSTALLPGAKTCNLKFRSCELGQYTMLPLVI